MPSTVPVIVSESMPAALAMPKSATRTPPSLVEEQVPRLDVAMDDAVSVRGVERVAPPARASERLARLDGVPVLSRSSSEPPSRYSMTMNGRSRHSPTSKIVTVFGSAERRAAASASRVKRARTDSSRA